MPNICDENPHDLSIRQETNKQSLRYDIDLIVILITATRITGPSFFIATAANPID